MTILTTNAVDMINPDSFSCIGVSDLRKRAPLREITSVDPTDAAGAVQLSSQE